jgi:hypothetical protein
MITRLFFLIFMLSTLPLLSQDYQLAPPITGSTRIVYKGNPTKIGLSFRMDGANIRYAIDDTLTGKSNVYVDSIVIDKPCTLRAVSIHPDYLASDPISIQVVELKKAFSSIIANPPHQKYPGFGSKTLNDLNLGSLNFSKDYLGYNGEEIVIEAQMDKKSKIKNVFVSALTSQGSWIFGPSEITVLDGYGKEIGYAKFQENTIKCNGKKYKNIKIIIKPLSTIPDWHNGKGSPAWLFVDEVWYE